MQGSTVATATSKLVRVGLVSPVSKIDPRESADSISDLVLGQVFEAPYAIDPGATHTRPQLLEPLRADGKLQYSAAVRPGVKFSDGTPLTAEIVARSLRGAKILQDKTTVDVKGDRVWFTLTAPNPRFDLTLSQSNTGIVLDRATQLLGTGPYMFDHRPNLRLLQAAKSFRLIRNPHHTGKTAVDEIEFRVCPADEDGTPHALVEAMRHGEIDVTTSLTMADLTANQISGVAPSLQPGSSTGFLVFNCERRALMSAEVRRGIALALDAHDIAAKSYDKNPVAFVAANLLPPMMGRAIGIPTTDRTEAKRLLDASGAKPSRLTLLVPWAPRPYWPKPVPAAHAVQKQLAEVGITVEVHETKTSDDFFGNLTRGNYDLALAGWIADTPDPADFFEALLWSKMCGLENHHSNHSRWRNATMDAALARFREDPTEEHKRELHRLIHDEAPLVPLIYGQSVVVHSRKMRNVSASATGILTLSGVSVS